MRDPGVEPAAGGELHLRPGGFPWPTVAGNWLTGWIVIDLDATVMTAASEKQGPVVTFKKTRGFHPLVAWCANTVAGHIAVLTAALKQVPGSSRAEVLVRVGGAGATHDLLKHREALNTARRTVRYTVGWKLACVDEQAIPLLPGSAWEDLLQQGGDVRNGYHWAELTGLNTREGRPDGMRLIVRRVRPSASPPTPAAAGCDSTAPGPGPTRSAWPGFGSRNFQPSPDGRTDSDDQRGTAGPGRWIPAFPQ